MNVLIKCYSCNWETYSKYFDDIIKRISKIEGFNISKKDIVCEKIDVEGKSLMAQRKKCPRCIYIYFDDNLKYIIGFSNTNFDEDKLLECTKLNKPSKYGGNDYHANTYFYQGINKQFVTYYEQKQKYPNVQMFFYALDIKKSYPHNPFNLMCYRELATIGFAVLNIDEINFDGLNKIGIKVNQQNMAYTSLNKFVNDITRISSKNTGNVPSYMKVIDYDYNIDDDEDACINTQNIKYIYTFKALAAEAYDSFLTMWVLMILSKNENKKIEFMFSTEKYTSAKKTDAYTKDFPDTITSLFELLGLDVVYENSDEIRQQQKRELDQYERAKKKNKLRNQELFKNNLRAKGMEVKCCLCGCEIEEILEAAHLWGVAEIKNASKKEIRDTFNSEEFKDLIDDDNPHRNEDFYRRYIMANCGDNGIWLCSNHHGLYDNHFYCFDSDNGKVVINIEKLKDETEVKEFFDFITKTPQLANEILTPKTKIFLSHNKLNNIQGINDKN